MSSRDKWIMMLLPAVAIVLLYIWLYSEQGNMFIARRELEKARAGAATPAQLAAARTRLAGLQQDQVKVKAERKALDDRWTALGTTRNLSPAARAEAFQRLSRTIWKGGLFTVEEAPLEGNNTQIPASLDEMFKRLANNNPTGGNAPAGNAAAGNVAISSQQRLWKVRFLGRYKDVRAMLETLATEDTPIIPVSISMSQAPLETDWRNWTLLVWM